MGLPQSWPPFEPPEELDEPDDDELELDDDEELDELDEDEPPLEVEVEVDPPEVEVELPPDEVEVEPPEVELPPEEVEVEPPVLVDVMTMLPPLEPLEPKKPPKKPPPKPPPLEPPITVTPPLPPETGGGGGMYGAGIGTQASSCSQQAGFSITRRMRLTTRGAGVARRATCRRALGLGFATLTCFTYSGRVVAGASATCTAPPPTSAPPTAKADNFARAIRTDIGFAFFVSPASQARPIRTPRGFVSRETQTHYRSTIPLTVIEAARMLIFT